MGMTGADGRSGSRGGGAFYRRPRPKVAARRGLHHAEAGRDRPALDQAAPGDTPAPRTPGQRMRKGARASPVGLEVRNTRVGPYSSDSIDPGSDSMATRSRARIPGSVTFLGVVWLLAAAGALVWGIGLVIVFGVVDRF